MFILRNEIDSVMPLEMTTKKTKGAIKNQLLKQLINFKKKLKRFPDYQTVSIC
jgi:hypothetical protein